MDSILGSKELLYSMLAIEQPIIAAVQGFALGLGATIALFCDIVVAAEDAVLRRHPRQRGAGGRGRRCRAWPLLLPFGQAKYHLLTGDRITGTDAARMGMNHKAVPADQLLDEATAVARRLADGPTLALKWTKKAVNQVLAGTPRLDPRNRAGPGGRNVLERRLQRGVLGLDREAEADIHRSLSPGRLRPDSVRDPPPASRAG